MDGCYSKLSTVNKLLMHLRIFHPFEANTRLRCAIEKCLHISSTTGAYRKHVERKHRHLLKEHHHCDQHESKELSCKEHSNCEYDSDCMEVTELENDLTFPSVAARRPFSSAVG